MKNSAFDHEEEEGGKAAKERAAMKGKFKEFDCPSCTANNPADPPFGNDDEVLCNYCGTEYKAQVNDEGKLKLREL
jgi:uncharacterized Zn-finger protein